MADFVDCPFCDEADFDLPGLKSHLLYGDCLSWNQTDETRRVFSEPRPSSGGRP